jgi:hypothetical protein
MIRIVGSVLVLLLAMPAFADDDKAKDKDKKSTPAVPLSKPDDKEKSKAKDKDDRKTPEEQLQALVEEYEDAQRAFSKAYREAKTDEDKQKVLKEKLPDAGKFAPRFVALAEKYPKDAAAINALVWVMINTRSGSADKDSPRSKAQAMLLRDHVASEKLGDACESLAYGFDKESERFLHAVLDKNPSAQVQAEACLALAQRLNQQAETAKGLVKNTDELDDYIKSYGKEVVEALKKADTAKLEAESERLFRRVADKYLPVMKQDRLTSLCQRLGYSSDKGSELILRALLDKDSRQDVQGTACLYLGKVFKNRADGMPEAEAKEAEKLRHESEQLLERALAKYKDVKAGFLGAVGRHAESELYELRFLSLGKTVPDIEGEDLDAQKFKLSDYRGKVVLLDFWGNW